jgi:hypothetical protein
MHVLVGTDNSSSVINRVITTLQERPQHLQPRVLLLRNLMRQSEGREGGVPALALQALKDAGRDPATSLDCIADSVPLQASG